MIIIIHVIYVLVSISFTYWVGKNLFKNGRVFLIEAFKQDIAMAESVNQLLLVGFYLVNFGLVSLFLSVGNHPENLLQAIEYLSYKFGVVLMVLGGMHFFNMRNIAKMRSRSLEKTLVNK